MPEDSLAISNIFKLPIWEYINPIPINSESAPISVYKKYLKAIISFLPVPHTPTSIHDGISMNSKNMKKAAKLMDRTVPIIPDT